MAVYYFKLLTRDGKLEKGLYRQSSPFPDKAINYLEQEQGILLELKNIPQGLESLATLFILGKTSLTRNDLAAFFANIGTLLNSGLSILDCLQQIRKDSNNPLFRQCLFFLYADVKSGLRFHEALHRQNRIFPSSIIYMAKIGDETGKLGQVCQKIAEHLSSIEDIRKKTRRALIYPAFSMLVVSAALGFWFYYVVPKVVGLFKELETNLPDSTRLIISISSFFQKYFYIFPLLLIPVISLLIFKKYSLRLRIISNRLISYIPVLKTINKISITSTICEYLNILTYSGLEIPRSVSIIRDSLKNEIYKQKLNRVLQSLYSGHSLTYGLKNHQVLLPFAQQILAVGDGNDKLAMQAKYAADHYQMELDHKVEFLFKILEPVLITTLGTIFALFLWGLLFPIYDLIANL